MFYLCSKFYTNLFSRLSLKNKKQIHRVAFAFIMLSMGIQSETEFKRIHLWRAQGNFDDSVLDKLYDRATLDEDIWIRDNSTIDFLILNEEQDNITSLLKEYGLNHTVLISDVRGKLDEALVKTFPTKRHALSGDTFTWNAYPSLRDVNDYLTRLVTTYPTHCKLITLGKTTQNKPIYMVKITNGNPNNKPILVTGGTQGREWTSVVSTLYFIDAVVKKFYQQPVYMINRDWHIIPVLNPDGYHYSITTDRLWKKNRRRLSGMCYGINLNKNFDDNWGTDGFSHNICSDKYCGPAAFSEEETRAIQRLTDPNSGLHFSGYISVQSGGTKILYPVKSQHEEHHDHIDMTKQIALAMRKISNKFFLNRDIGTKGKRNGGNAMDWMYHVRGVLHSYIIETRGQDGLDLLPPTQILPAAMEVNAGLMRFAEVLQ